MKHNLIGTNKLAIISVFDTLNLCHILDRSYLIDFKEALIGTSDR